MSRFDRYMLHVDVGTDEKLADLTVSERLCHVVGVLAVAAKSPIRGCLIVGDAEATAAHVARRAAVSERVAKRTIEKLIAVGVLIRDDEVGAWRVHRWDIYNPSPKADNTGAERQARYRQRLRQKGLTRVIPSAIKDFVMARDEARCVVCGSTGEVEFHHRVPVVDGGSNEAENVELRCLSCHDGDAGHASPSRRDARDGDGGSLRASAIACARSPEGKEEEEEGRKTPLPPKGERRRDVLDFEEQVKAYAMERFGLDSEDGWRNIKGAIVDGARSDEAVESWLAKWRPDLLRVPA